MKKIFMFLSAMLVAFSTFAGNDPMIGLNRKVQRDKGPVSNGFYLLLGVGFPSAKVNDSGFEGDRQSLGTQLGLEIGNQWLFYNNDEIGFGMNVSWLMFGYSQYDDDFYDSKSGNIALQLLKFGPQFTYGLGDDAAIDAYFDFIPVNFMFGANGDAEDAWAYSSIFTTFAPGIKLRYKVFTVGFEPQFGSMNVYSTDAPDEKTKVSYFNPRVLLGFKF